MAEGKTTISIAFGADNKGTFGLYETNAPARYDYGYTHEVYVENPGNENEGLRYVLIWESRAQYQRDRYSSGLGLWSKPSTALDERTLREILQEALWDGLTYKVRGR